MPRTNHKWMVAAWWCVPLCFTLHAASAAERSAPPDPTSCTEPPRSVHAEKGRSPEEGVVRIRGGELAAFGTLSPVAFEAGDAQPAGEACGVCGDRRACAGHMADRGADGGACRGGAVSHPPIIRPAAGTIFPQCPFTAAHVHPYLLTTRDVENQLKYQMWRTKALLDAHADPAAEGGWLAAKWWLKDQWAMYLARNRIQSAALNAQLHAKLAYFVPSGCGGAGCPPIGFYNLVYPANPWHIDRRDTQIYANPATGVPMVVPLPPNVEHVMHYSDDTPSSRLTRLGYRIYPR